MFGGTPSFVTSGSRSATPLVWYEPAMNSAWQVCQNAIEEFLVSGDERTGGGKGTEGDHVGLCAECRHMRRIESDRGARFYLCQLSASDPNFQKYPRLPVLQCRGYDLKAPS
jgi:hypothetical protein